MGILCSARRNKFNGMKKTLFTSLLSLTLFFALGTVLAYAQGGTPPPGGGGTPPVTPIKIDNPFNCRGTSDDKCTLFDLLKIVINEIIMPIGGVLAVLAFIYSGFLYVTAQGKETQVTKAHHALLYTAIGTAVLLGAWTIANVIQATINQLK